MFASTAQLKAILWAQWRSTRNFIGRRNFTFLVLGSLIAALPYIAFTILAITAVVFLSTSSKETVGHILSTGLLFLFLYWQIMPLLMAAGGLSLDLKKLLPYPIPGPALFGVEVLLRISAALEMLLLLAGVAVGLLLNPSIPFWGPLWLLPFIALNLLFSVGARDLLVRIMARKRMREVGAFLLIMLAVLPQLVTRQFASKDGPPPWLENLRQTAQSIDWPWHALSRLCMGQFRWADAGTLILCTAAAYWFGRHQFSKAIFTEHSEGSAAPPAKHERFGILEGIYRFPRAILRDPVAAIVEKEIRSLTRSPRFRLVFLMGFSFGLVIWMPMAMGRHGGWMQNHFLTVVSVYSLILLGDVLFWNALGFDRSAAMFYFAAPSGLRTAMIGKNLTALFFLLLEITMVTLACMVVRRSITPAMIAESYSVALVMAILLISIGNFSSLRNPRPIKPESSFGGTPGGASKAQFILLAVFPLAILPLGLAYLAWYAFDSQAAFFGVLALEAAAGLIAYKFGLDSAVARGELDVETIAGALTPGAGPISS